MPPVAYLDQRLHLRLDAFSRAQLDRVRALFVHDNPEYEKWQRFRHGRFPPKQVVGTWKQSGGYLHLPRGRTLEVCQLLAMEPRGSIDDRTVAGKHYDFTLKGVEHRDYQLRIVDALAEHLTCLCRSPQGSGKTMAAFLAVERLQTWTLVVVPNRALLDQWVVRARQQFGFEPAVIQGSRRAVGPLTIALQPTLLGCIDDVAPHFGLVICDEVQLFAAKTFNDIIEKCPARYRLGVSGDEHRADGKEFLIHDQFGEPPEGAVVDRQELLDAGTIVDVAVRFIPTEFRADWYTALKPDERFRMRGPLLEAMSADPDRNALVVAAAQSCLVEGEQVAVLTECREHCAILDTLVQQVCPTGQLLGGDGDREVFTDSLRRFAAGELRAVVGTYKAIGVGFESHQRLARGVFASPVVTQDTAEMQFNQYRGRFARSAPGKKDAIVYVLFDPFVHGSRPVQLVKKWVQVCEVMDDSGAFIPATDYLKGRRRAKAKRRSEATDSVPEPEDDLFKSRGRRSRA